VRSALLEGRIGEARALLGRAYSVSGTVVAGDRRGTKLGFPTANVAAGPGRCLPAPGVYATWVRLRARWWPAATSVGYRPTFGGTQLTTEAFLLGFSGNAYGEEVTVEFTARVRGERRFAGAGSLVAAMRRDVERVERILAGRPAPDRR
jgi:riboflavin kinase/FMN adenylyltransferase